jgi:glucosamine-6-phosphate deaminase
MEHKDFNIEQLRVLVFANRASLGAMAAKLVSDSIKSLLQEKPEISIIFAAAPSQDEFLEALLKDDSIPWASINAFHMDEYLRLSKDAVQLFSQFLKARLFDHRPFKTVNLINGNASDFNEECLRYASLLQKYPPDIVCMGIGENTHIAFNDPGEADFNDQQMVKVVALDEACRQQQVNDLCFDQLADVPNFAITLTIPVLTSAPFVFCMVPGKLKADAVARTLYEPVSDRYPSTILRTKAGAILLTDNDSFSLCG